MAKVIKTTITDRTLKREMFRVINEVFSHNPREIDIHFHGEMDSLPVMNVSYSYAVKPSSVDPMNEEAAKKLLKAIFEEEKEDEEDEEEEDK